MEEIKKGEKWNLVSNKWLMSFIINAAILVAVMACTPLMYESNDDLAISEELANGYPYVSFVNYYLCRVLIVLQGILPTINIFVLSQIIMSFFAFCIIIKVMLERKPLWIEVALSIFICSFFALDHYSDIQFTKTAALLMTAGLLLLVDNYTNERRLGSFAIAFAFLYIGAGYRANAMFPAIAYAGLFMLIWVFFNYKKIVGKKEVLIIVIIAVLTAVPYGLKVSSVSMNRSSDELNLCRDYQSERIRITDYPLLGNYEEASAEYEEVGIDKNDLSIMNKWFFDYDGAASLENLKKINSINQPYVKSKMTVKTAVGRALRNVFKSVISLNMTGTHIIVAIVLFAAIIFTTKKRAWISAISVGILTVFLYCYIYYNQRVQYRALYIADISAIVWLLYIFISNKKEGCNKRRLVSCIIGIMVLAFSLIPAMQNLYSSSGFNENLVEDEVFTNYFKNHEDCLFVAPARTMAQPIEYINPLKVPNTPINKAATGGWETLSPYELSRLEKYGVYNPLKDMINNPRVLYYGENMDEEHDSLIEYYRKWHCNEGENIYFEKVDEVEDVGIYKLIRE